MEKLKEGVESYAKGRLVDTFSDIVDRAHPRERPRKQGKGTFLLGAGVMSRRTHLSKTAASSGRKGGGSRGMWR